jgi:hypothetical protein
VVRESALMQLVQGGLPEDAALMQLNEAEQSGRWSPAAAPAAHPPAGERAAGAVPTPPAPPAAGLASAAMPEVPVADVVAAATPTGEVV